MPTRGKNIFLQLYAQAFLAHAPKRRTVKLDEPSDQMTDPRKTIKVLRCSSINVCLEWQKLFITAEISLRSEAFKTNLTRLRTGTKTRTISPRVSRADNDQKGGFEGGLATTRNRGTVERLAFSHPNWEKSPRFPVPM